MEAVQIALQHGVADILLLACNHAVYQPFELTSHYMHCTVHSPSAAWEASVAVREGDIVLVSSDGLFNNVYEEEILHVLKDVKVTTVITLFMRKLLYLAILSSILLNYNYYTIIFM